MQRLPTAQSAPVAPESALNKKITITVQHPSTVTKVPASTTASKTPTTQLSFAPALPKLVLSDKLKFMHSPTEQPLAVSATHTPMPLSTAQATRKHALNEKNKPNNSVPQLSSAAPKLHASLQLPVVQTAPKPVLNQESKQMIAVVTKPHTVKKLAQPALDAKNNIALPLTVNANNPWLQAQNPLQKLLKHSNPTRPLSIASAPPQKPILKKHSVVAELQPPKAPKMDHYLINSPILHNTRLQRAQPTKPARIVAATLPPKAGLSHPMAKQKPRSRPTLNIPSPKQTLPAK